MLWNIVTVSYRQRLIPNDLLGRAAALHGPYLFGAIVCSFMLIYGMLRLRFDR